ncbi:Ccdc34p [Cichlidogyrus casuarinus]|uniref:Ccdc34p n=1 Tax=Cichlidogyrus casuarinus TaxID=1844966 RepID=A0ABD2PLL9_9PLAT
MTKSKVAAIDPQLANPTRRKVAFSKQNEENIHAIRSTLQTLTDNRDMFANLESLQNLGPWEQWILKKETERRKHLAKKRSKQMIIELETEKQQIDESIKKQQRKLARIEWMKKVTDREEAERVKMEEEKKREIDAQQLRESHKILKSHGPYSYSAWLKRKHEREKAMKDEFERKNRELMSQKMEKAKNAEQAFKAWKRRHASASERNFYTEGLTQDGRIISKSPVAFALIFLEFYDRTANPIPEFNNPVEWT